MHTLNKTARTWVEIDLRALKHNLEYAKRNIGRKVICVIKADAYGHGAVQVARLLQDAGADYLAVSCLDEAMELRRSGVYLPILILGHTSAEFTETLIVNDLTQAVTCLAKAEEYSREASRLGRTLRVHIKLDTGMSRLGFLCYGENESLDQIRFISRMEHLELDGIFTHFPAADSYAPADEDFTELQFQRFTDTVKALEAMGIRFRLRHCCNSAATLLHPEFALDMVRPGIATYGISPSEEMEGKFDLRPLMSLKTTLSQIRTLPKGVSVSYGRSWTSSSERVIAVAAIGYADGLSRSLSNDVCFLLRGKRVPVVGRICMDMCMLDVTEVPDAREGDVVTVFGSDGGDFLSVDDLARKLNTIPYEILCDINKRIPRIYLDGSQRMDILQYIV
jgi:alanine racemase